MRSLRKSLRGHFWKRVIAYVLVWSLVMNTSVPLLLAGPTGGAVDTGLNGGGTADITYNTGLYGHTTLVDVDTNRTIINWTSLNTVGGAADVRETLSFTQGALTNSAVLNRVSGAATQFYGDLTAPGMRIFVVNPAGMVFGPGSTVNVSQLVLSGLGMTNEAFNNTIQLGDEMVFSGGAGSVYTRALVNAGSVYLVGKKVTNNGSILAPNGVIVLAAGDNVQIAQDGSNVISQILVDPGETTPDIDNRSLLAAKNGSIILAACDDFSRVIRNVGFIVAYSGKITVRAPRIENRQTIAVSASMGDAGTITLSGREGILFGPDGLGVHSETVADGGVNGSGGTIILETEGTITFPKDEYMSARGHSTTGNGGTIKLTCEHFMIDGEIDASPQNPDYANGTLTIDPPAVDVVDGVNAGAMDTVYTDDIETLSTTGTNLIVHADNSVTVKNLVDGIIGGRGDIKFETGPDGAITFEDPSDTISTTRGSIGLSAGAGGIVAGSLETGDPGFVPGQINVETALGSGGSVAVQNLKVREGQSSGQINVKADGNLTVNGTVAVGSVNPIDNNVSGGNVEAKVKLESGDDMALKGGVAANSHATGSGDPTSSVQLFVGVDAGSKNHGTAGNLDVDGGDLVATAQADAGTSYALVEVETYGTIDWHGHQASATADVAHVEGTETKDQVDGSDKAELIITVHGNLPELEGLPDSAVTHMGDPVIIDVLANDNKATGATKDTDPTHGTVVQNPDGTFTYTPKAGYKGDDSFTYTATDGVDTTGPVTVTITMNNDLPVPVADSASTHWDQAVGGNVLTNDTDADLDPLNVVLDGTAPTHGTVVLNADGSFTYTPTDTGYVGTDQFTYEVTDGQLDGLGNPVVQTGTVTITFGNNLPNAAPDTANTHMNQAVGGNVLTNDTDAELDPLSVVLDGTAPTHGTVVLNPDGSFTYTPTEAGYVGPDTFTYEVTDGQLDAGNPVVVTGTVTVNIGNNLPVAINDEATTITGNPVSGNVLTNDTDLDGDPLAVVLDGTAPTNGTVILNPDGSFTYEPNPGYVGEDTFTYEISDGQGGTTEPISAMVTICVEPSPAPSISPVAPGLERRDIDYSGCPALAKWVAKELGVDESKIDIWMVNALASSRDIQPFETYARLRTAAVILKDVGGSHIVALTQVINEFASSTAPPTEEQMASIADAIASNAGADNQYGIAEEYLNALAQYISILNAEMGLSMEEAVEYATTNYVNQLAERGNANVAAYVTAKLAEL